MHENILRSIIRLNKAKALLTIKPLNGSCWHLSSPKLSRVKEHALQFNWSDDFGKEPAGAFKKAQRLIEWKQLSGAAEE